MSRLLSISLIITVCNVINQIEGGKTTTTTTTIRTDENCNVEEKDFPFIILIAGLIRKANYKKVNRIGTGILLTPIWGLTAAHIFENIDRKKREILCVWYGEFTQSPFDTNTFTEVFKIFVHPSFRKTPYISEDLYFNTNDVALMYISKVNVAGYAKLSAVDREALFGRTARYIGVAHSSVNKSGDNANRRMKFGQGLITRCGPPVNKFSTNLLCVTPSCQTRRSRTKYSGACGDPLFVDGKIVGVFTMSYFAHSSSLMWTAFTPIEMYTDWINYIMRKENSLRRTFQRYMSNDTT